MRSGRQNLHRGLSAPVEWFVETVVPFQMVGLILRRIRSEQCGTRALLPLRPTSHEVVCRPTSLGSPHEYMDCQRLNRSRSSLCPSLCLVDRFPDREEKIVRDDCQVRIWRARKACEAGTCPERSLQLCLLR